LTEAGEALADHEVYLAPGENYEAAVVSHQTDATGRFHWDAVPAQMHLHVRLRGDSLQPRYYISTPTLNLKPGELLENATPSVRELNRPPRPDVPLAEAVPLVCRDAALNPMGALVVMEGDETVHARDLVSRLLDGEDTPDILAYRLISMSPKQQTAEAAAIADRKWPKPQAGEVVLIVLDTGGAQAADVRLKSDALEASLTEGRKFLAAHRPAQRDAMAILAAAREEAKASGRRMWVVSGGPRCGPCFRLARWMNDQHSLLEKDYVLVKILGGVDKNSDAVVPLLPGAEGSGIPYHAILEPDDKVLITSKGRDGNIGMPGGAEGISHLKRMLVETSRRLSAAEIAVLENSLKTK
ncbi:MAG TPA: thioredoxin family protein, partial [Pirellulales bacterium]